MKPRSWVLIATTTLLSLSGAAFYFQGRLFGMQAAANAIAREVAELRGLSLEHPILVKRETQVDFEVFLERQLRRQELPDEYGDIVRMLGLYRGPRIDDPVAMFKRVLGTAAGGYYDVERKQMALLRDLPEPRRSSVLAHEIYHAIQDQYFDVAKYYADARNADEQLARRSVVEGEATYIQTMYALRDKTGQPPSPKRLHEFIAAQPIADRDSLPGLLRGQNVRKTMGDESFAAVQGLSKLPAFMWETLSGNAVLGMKFIDAVRPRGWTEVEKLYRERPPASTEQILHPEKWLAGEAPVAIEWPAFSGDRFVGWRLLQQGVIGEFQWRLVFRENGFAFPDAAAAAEGWGGDRFAVFRNDTSGKLLLLLYTAWDTPAAAATFAANYRRALQAKYANDTTPTRIVAAEREVLIVEGGDEPELAGFVDFLDELRRSR